MKVINIADVPTKTISKPLFTGAVERQSPVTDDEGSQVSIDYVHFPEGVRNKLHVHSNDQVLIVTKGKGVVATESSTFEVGEGDIIWTPAGEAHWHGAAQDSSFTHISVTPAHTSIIQREE